MNFNNLPCINREKKWYYDDEPVINYGIYFDFGFSTRELSSRERDEFEFVVYEAIDAFEDNLYSILVSETVCIIINERMSEWIREVKGNKIIAILPFLVSLPLVNIKFDLNRACNHGIVINPPMI